MARVTAMAEIRLPDSTVLLREAVQDDVPLIVALLADDQLGAARDGVTGQADLAPYLRAFSDLDADPAHLLVVAADGAAVVATMQLSLLPGLARRGARRAQLEAVRVHADYRSRGLGTAMFEWDRGVAAPRCRPGPADHGQIARRRPSVLRAVRLRRFP